MRREKERQLRSRISPFARSNSGGVDATRCSSRMASRRLCVFTCSDASPFSRHRTTANGERTKRTEIRTCALAWPQRPPTSDETELKRPPKRANSVDRPQFTQSPYSNSQCCCAAKTSRKGVNCVRAHRKNTR